MITLIMALAGVCGVFGDTTAHFALDSQEGARLAGATEDICFSPAWETETAGACAVVSIDGMVVTNSTEEGSYVWTPTRNGTYTLTHQVVVGGESVGETLTATFKVEGRPTTSSATTHLSLDTLDGVRAAEVTEDISFSPAWETESAGACAIVSVDGVAVTNACEAGVYPWTPTRDGTYTLTHKVMDGNAQVGETLTATFVVAGLNPEAPVISPASGTTFGSSQTISMSCASAGATIRYTTDGSVPTMESTEYKRFRISGKTTIKAIAFYEDGTASEMAVAEYALGRCADPVIRSAGGVTFAHGGNLVTILAAREVTSSTEGSGSGYVADQVVRYTVDGSDVTRESPVYTGPFTIDESTVVKAKVFSDTFFDSAEVTASLTREWEPVATPVITAVDSFTGSKAKVVMACATPGATIRYTTNGNTPNSHSTKYTKPFYVTEGCTVKAYAILKDYTNSEVATKTITKVWGIGDTLGKPDHAFSTSGDAGFVKVTDATAALGESMRSGAITNEESSVLSTTVVGPGTLSFKWKTDCEEDELHEWDHAEFAVDGVVIKVLDGETDWVDVEYAIAGAGEHTVTWTYVKDDVEFAGEDCLWVSEYNWVTALTETQTTDVPVPYAWLLEKCPDAVDEYGIYESVAKQPAANGRQTVAECYVAGLDPEDPTAAFTAKIEMEGGVPSISWDPDLGEERAYRVEGRESLTEGDWSSPVTDAQRFFRVVVEMP